MILTESTTGKTLAEIIERERNRLRGILADGFPEAYRKSDGSLNTHDFECDFFPDFSWNDYILTELRAVVADPEWNALAVQIKEKHGYDFVDLLDTAISEEAGDETRH